MSCERTEDVNGIESFFKSFSPVYNLPVNDTVNPIVTVGGYEPTWLFGDGNKCERDASPTHTYLGTPPYAARIGDVDRSRITHFELTGTAVDNVDLESFRQLDSVDISGNGLTSLDISRNNALLDVNVSNNLIPEDDIDDMIIQLAENGLFDGVLNYEGNADATSFSAPAYCLLVERRWKITGLAPTLGFTIKIDTTLSGESNANQFIFPGQGLTPYNIDWGDCDIEMNVVGEQIHTFEEAGIYFISVSETLESIRFSPLPGVSDAPKVLEVVKWGVGVWTTFNFAFAGCRNMTAIPTDAPDLSGLTVLSSMFKECESLTTIDFGPWDKSRMHEMTDMMLDCVSLTSLNVSGLVTSVTTKIDGLLDGCFLVPVIDVSAWDTVNVLSFAETFAQCQTVTVLDVANFDFTSCTSINRIFKNCNSVLVLDVSTWDTTGIVNFSDSFSECSSVSVLNVSGFNTASGTTFNTMFNQCSGLSVLDLTSFNMALATNIGSMIAACSGLSVVDVSGFNTSNVTIFSGFFDRCSGMAAIDISAWDVSSGTRFSGFLASCQTLTTLTLNPVFDLSSAEHLDRFFASCPLLPLPSGVDSWSTSLVSLMQNMFNGALLMNPDLSGWNIGSMGNASNILVASAFSDANYDLLLVGWEGQAHNNGINLDVGLAKFSAGAPATARAALISDLWVISDGGPV